MAATGTTSSQGSSLPQEIDLDSKIFGKGKAQKSEEREKIRRKIEIRIGVVTQLSGDVVEDMEIALFIEAIVAKALLTLYCAEFRVAKTGTKVEQIQRLLRAGWNLGTDEALQADYTKLQPKHGTSDDDDTKTVQGDEKDQAATGKRITRAAPKATEVKADTEEPRPQAPRPAATGTLPIPLGHPPQGARDLRFPPEFQHWLDEDTSRRPPPPPYPYGRENTEHLPPRRIEDSFGSVLNRLASSIEAQAKAAKLAVETGEEAKEVALPGTLSTKVKKAFIAGEYVNIMALWDKDVAKARIGFAGQRAATRPPKAAEECYWDDWILAMLYLSQKYYDARQDILSRQVIKLLTGATQGTAKYTRASIMEASEVLRQDHTYPSCASLDFLLLHGRCRIILEPLTEGSSGTKRKFTTFFYGKSRPTNNGPCRWWLLGKECKFGTKCTYRHSCTACPKATSHDPSTCPISSGRRRLRQPQ